MKKLFSLLLASVVTFSMVGCGGNSNEETTSDKGSNSSGTKEIALVTDIGSIDDGSFNQASWEGLVKYAEENDISHQYYKPEEQSTDSTIASIELAIRGGAKIVVCPGFLFEEPVYKMQEKYPDVKFIIVDAIPALDGELKITDNTVSIFFAEEQAGFLAGYAAVMDGYRNLGFMGGIAQSPVIRFGYGFIDGAEYAGKELGLKEGDINMNYTYIGNFNASPENVTRASAWYNEGTEIIFGCAAAAGDSIMRAAETAGKKVIGVDIDQSDDSETVVTSAMKNLGVAIYDTLTDMYTEGFVGGNTTVFRADTNSVQLPMETSRFETFTQEQYDTIYQKLISDEIIISNEQTSENADGLNTSIVNVTLR